MADFIDGGGCEDFRMVLVLTDKCEGLEKKIAEQAAEFADLRATVSRYKATIMRMHERITKAGLVTPAEQAVADAQRTLDAMTS